MDAITLYRKCLRAYEQSDSYAYREAKMTARRTLTGWSLVDFNHRIGDFESGLRLDRLEAMS